VEIDGNVEPGINDSDLTSGGRCLGDDSATQAIAADLTFVLPDEDGKGLDSDIRATVPGAIAEAIREAWRVATNAVDELDREEGSHVPTATEEIADNAYLRMNVLLDRITTRKFSSFERLRLLDFILKN
jgi:hypothetical protein